MDTKVVASSVFGVGQNEIEHFDVQDRFNDNRITGYMCTRADHRYGALLIFSVNGHWAFSGPIYCTPKLHYPFKTNDQGERVYNWPKSVTDVRVYDKLDGTAICCYMYQDRNNNRFVTFKTRLTPVLRENKYGDFYGMWCEILKRYPELRWPGKVATGAYTFTYELHGYRNPILIKYPFDLDAKLLFTVPQQWDRESIVDVPDHYIQRPLKAIATANDAKSTQALYERLREEALKLNKVNDDGSISGTEGYIFYVRAAGERGYKQFKCKPADIETIHWANTTIPRHAILTTVWNSLENRDDVDKPFILGLLGEEFTDQQIERSMTRIDKAVDYVTERLLWRAKVDNTYKGLPVSMEDGRNEVMRELSLVFPRDRMRDVYNALRELGHAK